MRFLIASSLLIISIGAFNNANAEGLSLDEESGGWIAMRIPEEDGIACSAGRSDQEITFNATKSAIEIRFTDPNWSFPVGKISELQINTSGYYMTFKGVAYKPTSVGAVISPDDVLPIIDNILTRSSVRMAFSGVVKVVSLSGNRRAINSFKKCVQSKHYGDMGL